MNSAPHCLLVRILREPARAAELTLVDWDVLLRQARHANLLAGLDHRIETTVGVASLPEQVRLHLLSARRFAAAHARVVRWEVGRIVRALTGIDVPVVLLKGAAYLLAGLPAAQGRVFNDVDILVPKDRLPVVEEALYWSGWMTTHHDDYDQRYYRQWMHEIPPLRHIKRQTVLDVHHNILPETARLHPDPIKLLQSARRLEDAEPLHVLSDVDMVLHSATHLFHDGELEHGLRDLVDLDALLRHFSRQTETFWEVLQQRAELMQLTRPLYYALRYTHEFLATPVSAQVMERIHSNAPPMLLRDGMDQLFRRALAPDHASCEDAWTGMARGILYVRAHYLRMPMHLLLPHLLRKAFRREEPETA